MWYRWSHRPGRWADSGSIDGRPANALIATLVAGDPCHHRRMGDHPASDDPNAPLRSKLSEADGPSYRQSENCLEKHGFTSRKVTSM